MKKLSQRSLLLFGVTLAVSAFVVPSMAWAATWSPVNSTHELFSSNLTFATHGGPLGAAGWSCAGWESMAHVASAQSLVITNGRFSNCTGTGGASSCLVTPTFTGQWQATPVSTTNIQIHNVVLDISFSGASGVCAANGARLLLTGTLSGGATWNPANNTVNLANATGLTAHYLGVGVSSTTTLNGQLRDTTSTLRLFD